MPPNAQQQRAHGGQDGDGEREPLLNNRSAALDGGEAGDSRELLSFDENDAANPRQWPRRRKMMNVAVIAAMSILSPLASSMFTPGIEQIAEDLGSTPEVVIGCTTGFVIMLGFGPLFLAPLSETFGRRRIYILCFTVFAALQIPSALAPNIETLIAMRTLSGFFGSVGIANGGGTISDMFAPSERASVFGWYLLGPLLGPTLGPLFGGVIVQRLDWRWIFWVLVIVCFANTAAGFFFLRETYAPVILQMRRESLEKDGENPGKYRVDGQDERPLGTKLLRSFARPLRILVQPIVLLFSTYQALLFGTTYSIYTNMQPIYSGEYGFNTEQVGLLYLGPGLGFLFAVWFLVPRIDTVYNTLASRNDGKAKPEYRLPLANIGAVFIPVSLFWFAWTVEYHTHWFASIAATFFYGIGQVMILNTCQNYYIDSFEKYAASAIAAGAVFRSLLGGVVPLFAPAMFDKLGYGWGISVFAFLALAISPAPVVFFFFVGSFQVFSQADPSVPSTQSDQILNATAGAGEDDSFRTGESSSPGLVRNVAAGFNTFSQATREVRPNAALRVDDTNNDDDGEAGGEGETGKKRKRWWAGFSPPPDANLFPATNEVADAETTPISMRMPPVIGSYMLFPNKRLRCNPIPPNIDEIREKSFYMTEPILLKNSQEIADVVPHLSKLWRRVQ